MNVYLYTRSSKKFNKMEKGLNIYIDDDCTCSSVVELTNVLQKNL